MIKLQEAQWLSSLCPDWGSQVKHSLFDPVVQLKAIQVELIKS
jgi:hypothetical protein